MLISDRPDICIICDEPIAPGTGGVRLGSFPALHAKCARLANEGTGLNDDDLVEAIAPLLQVRSALARAVNNMPAEAVLAAIGLLLCDLLAHVQSHKELVAAGLVDEIRHLGEMMAAGAGDGRQGQ